MVATEDEDEPNTVLGVVTALAPIVELRDRKRPASPIAPAPPPVEKPSSRELFGLTSGTTDLGRVDEGAST